MKADALNEARVRHSTTTRRLEDAVMIVITDVVVVDDDGVRRVFDGAAFGAHCCKNIYYMADDGGAGTCGFVMRSRHTSEGWLVCVKRPLAAAKWRWMVRFLGRVLGCNISAIDFVILVFMRGELIRMVYNIHISQWILMFF